MGFKRLGLAVIDEQHRFGVAHRAAIRGKGESPDVLVMTATPIPRTLALTLYGDLDVSVLDELPPGRRPIVTVARGESKRREIYDFLRKQIGEGRQVYVVCPLVEESEVSDLRAATEMAERLQREVFPDRRVGLIHGRLGFQDKERVMREFKEGAVHVLVSTTVIEVGIDVPNASVMLIEHAERFGLSQLHQLRGRVGRGPWKSYCILLAGSSSEDARRRIAAMTETNDGFRIAEVDLELRGPGDFFGTRQSGLPEFRVADLLRDGAMLEEARREAFALVQADPQLTASEHRGLRGGPPRPLARQARPGGDRLMRVIAGALKGQRLTTPKGRTTRPTADQVRIACLDTLMPYLEAGPFLDLFAGAGGVGIEALSRGAPSAVFVEQDRARRRGPRGQYREARPGRPRQGLAPGRPPRARGARARRRPLRRRLPRSALRFGRRRARARAARARRLPPARRRRRGAALDQDASAGRARRPHALEGPPLRGDHLDFLSRRRVE